MDFGIPRLLNRTSVPSALLCSGADEIFIIPSCAARRTAGMFVGTAEHFAKTTTAAVAQATICDSGTALAPIHKLAVYAVLLAILFNSSNAFSCPANRSRNSTNARRATAFGRSPPKLRRVIRLRGGGIPALGVGRSSNGASEPRHGQED